MASRKPKRTTRAVSDRRRRVTLREMSDRLTRLRSELDQVYAAFRQTIEILADNQDLIRQLVAPTPPAEPTPPETSSTIVDALDAKLRAAMEGDSASAN